MPDLFVIFIFFRALLMPQIFILNIFSDLFALFYHLSLGFFTFFQIFLLSAFISMPQVFEQSMFLFPPPAYVAKERVYLRRGVEERTNLQKKTHEKSQNTPSASGSIKGFSLLFLSDRGGHPLYAVYTSSSIAAYGEHMPNSADS